MTSTDVIVVGAGTAGCVVAAHLVASGRSVTVIEAGPEVADPPAPFAPDAADGLDWGLSATTCDGRPEPLIKGKAVGGCSMVNQCGAVRALSTDFAAWSGLGLPGWSWESVLPAYRRLESDHEFGDRPGHGSRGPVPVRRPGELSGVAHAFLEATRGSGHDAVEDLNAPGVVGVGPYPHSVYPDGTRASTADTHLAPVRGRLRLVTGTSVDRLLLDRTRVVGVQTGGTRMPADEVVLCCGSPLTPLLLLRSGIGPARDLAAAGIDPVADLPGVGRTLRDQPGVVLPCLPRPGVVTKGAPVTEVFGRLTGVPGAPEGGGHYLTPFVGPPPDGGPEMIALMTADLAPGSTGRVRVDETGSPRIDLGYFTDVGDLPRLRAAYRYALTVADHPVLAGLIESVLVDREVVADDAALSRMLRSDVFSRLALHGGACMGPESDPEAVTGTDGRVRGVEGLRVVDLSIVPVPLRAPTALDAMMIAEHLCGPDEDPLTPPPDS